MEEQAKYELKVDDKRINHDNTQELIVPENNFFSMIERLASRPDIDVTKIQQLIDMQERIIDKQAKQSFNSSMVRTQRAMETIPRDKKNDQTNSWYSSHETIVRYATPIYTNNGFSLTFYEGETTKEQHTRIMCDILHEEGHSEIRHVDLSLDDKGIKGNVNKTKIHAEGSTFSYGRRYLTCLIFNIPTGDDDDGNQGKTPDTTKYDEWVEAFNRASSDRIPGLIKFWKENGKIIQKECGAGPASKIYRMVIEAKKDMAAPEKPAEKEPEREPGQEG